MSLVKQSKPANRKPPPSAPPIIYNVGPPVRTYSKDGATIHVWGDGMVTRHTEEWDEWWRENE